MTSRSHAANDALRFVLELGALAALAYWGWQATGSPARWALVACVPFAAAGIWGTFVAPKARFPARDPWRLLLEVAVFGGGAAALAAAGKTTIATALAALAALHLLLTFAFGRRRPLSLR